MSRTRGEALLVIGDLGEVDCGCNLLIDTTIDTSGVAVIYFLFPGLRFA